VGHLSRSLIKGGIKSGAEMARLDRRPSKIRHQPCKNGWTDPAAVWGGSGVVGQMNRVHGRVHGVIATW